MAGFVQHTGDVIDGAGTSSTSIPVTAAPVVGNMLTLAANFDTTTVDITSVSDDAGNVWRQDRPLGTSGTEEPVVWSAPVTGVPTTINVNLSGISRQKVITVDEWSGVDLSSSRMDVTANRSESSTLSSFSLATGTPNEAESLVVGVVAWKGGSVAAPTFTDSSFTEASQKVKGSGQHDAIHVGYTALSSAAPATFSGSWVSAPAAPGWTATVIVYKAATGTPGTKHPILASQSTSTGAAAVRRLGGTLTASSVSPSMASASLNQGYSWRKGGQNNGGYCNVIACDAGVATAGGDVWAVDSTDNGGDFWYPTNEGIVGSSSRPYIRCIAYSQKYPGRRYLGVGTLKYASGTGGGYLAKIEPGSYTLDQVNTDISFTSYLPTGGAGDVPRPVGRLIAVHYDAASDTETLYLATRQGVYRSTDDGVTLTPLGLTPPSPLFAWSALAIDPNGDLFVSSFRTSDTAGSQCWKIKNPAGAATVTQYSGLPAVVEDAKVISTSSGDKLALACGTYGIQLIDGTVLKAADSTIHYSCIEQASDGAIYVGNGIASTSQKYVAKSSDRGATWSWVTPASAISKTILGTNRTYWLAGAWSFMAGTGFSVSQLAADPSDPSRVYLAGRAGVWQTRDGGSTWAPCCNGLDGSESNALILGAGGEAWATDTDYKYSHTTDYWVNADNPQTGPTPGATSLSRTVGGHSYQVVANVPPEFLIDGQDVADDFFRSACVNPKDLAITSTGTVMIACSGGVLVGDPPGTAPSRTDTAIGSSVSTSDSAAVVRRAPHRVFLATVSQSGTAARVTITARPAYHAAGYPSPSVYPEASLLPGAATTTTDRPILTSDSSSSGHATVVATRTGLRLGWHIELGWEKGSGIFTIGSSRISGGDVLGGPFDPPTWEDVTGEVYAMTIDRGSGDATSQKREGSFALTLIDTTGKYNPRNRSSSLYGILDVNRPCRAYYVLDTTGMASTPAGFTDNGDGTATSYQWNGWVSDIIGPGPPHQSPYATIQGVDMFGRLSIATPTISGTAQSTTGAGIGSVLFAIGWRGDTNLDTGDAIPGVFADGTQAALDVIGDIIAAEGGVFFIAADGTPTYIDHGGDLTLSATIETSNLIRPGLSLDNVGNIASVTRTDSQGNALGAEQTYQDPTSVNAYGAREVAGSPLSTPYVVSDGQALSLAKRLVVMGKDPRAPIWNLTVQKNDDPTLYALMLGLDVGARVSINDSGSGTVGDFTIEGLRHDVSMGATDHAVTWVLRERLSGVFTIGQSVLSGPDVLAV